MSNGNCCTFHKKEENSIRRKKIVNLWKPVEELDFTTVVKH